MDCVSVVGYAVMDEEEKNNVCPICSRGFPKLAGLRQHVTKSHTVEEINLIIEENTRRLQHLPQQQQQPPPQRFGNTQLQIIKDDSDSSTGKSFHQFNIIENKASGDCLFLVLLEYLQRHKHLFPNTPNNAQELRTTTVDHIVLPTDAMNQSNFGRFKESIMVSPNSYIDTDASEELSKIQYAKYMASPGTYGTTAELCAMAEIFNFSFYVIRKDNDEDYSCYDYGSMEKFVNHRTNAVVFLLFTGSTGGGHFRLLVPDKSVTFPVIPTGAYKKIVDYTTSRLTSICPLASISNFIVEPPPNTGNATSDIAFEDFAILLARCKLNIRVLKRVPRGARMAAANKLSKCVEECLVNPNLSTNWKNLLTFAYTALRVPDKVKNVSLATMVKRNIEKEELIFQSQRKKRAPISLSKRVEYKIAEGDVKGAVRILSSSDALAPQNVSTFEQLKLKHPPPSREMNFPDPPDKNTEPLVVTERDIFYSIKSFPNGSSAGIDGIHQPAKWD